MELVKSNRASGEAMEVVESDGAGGASGGKMELQER